jgi:hypothetical protein
MKDHKTIWTNTNAFFQRIRKNMKAAASIKNGCDPNKLTASIKRVRTGL